MKYKYILSCQEQMEQECDVLQIKGQCQVHKYVLQVAALFDMCYYLYIVVFNP
jgi:hypothetical protein